MPDAMHPYHAPSPLHSLMSIYKLEICSQWYSRALRECYTLVYQCPNLWSLAVHQCPEGMHVSLHGLHFDTDLKNIFRNRRA